MSCNPVQKKHNPSPDHVIKAMKALRQSLGMKQGEFGAIFGRGGGCCCMYEKGYCPWPDWIIKDAYKTVSAFLLVRYTEHLAAAEGIRNIADPAVNLGKLLDL